MCAFEQIANNEIGTRLTLCHVCTQDIHYALSRSRKSEEDERRAKFDEAEDETEVDVSWSTKPLIPNATKDTDEAMDVESIKKSGKSEANDDEDDDEE